MVEFEIVEVSKFCCTSGGGGTSVIIKPPKLSLKWGLGVAELDIQNVNVLSFILGTKTFLRTVFILRYSVKKLNFLITVFLETPSMSWCLSMLSSVASLYSATLWDCLDLDQCQDHYTLLPRKLITNKMETSGTNLQEIWILSSQFGILLTKFYFCENWYCRKQFFFLALLFRHN